MDIRPRFRRSLATAFVVAFFSLVLGTTTVLASTGAVDAINPYAWDDNGGYVNWAPTGGNVAVTDTALSGYIWSVGFGWINLAPDQGGVTNSAGRLGGYAWGANTGWINFVGVTIDSNGRFHGQTTAQSLVGTMTFDCTYCNVTTTWRNSSVAATNAGGGGTISGAQSYGYESAATSTVSVSTTPLSLVPTALPPATIKPKSGPTSGATTGSSNPQHHVEHLHQAHGCSGHPSCTQRHL